MNQYYIEVLEKLLEDNKCSLTPERIKMVEAGIESAKKAIQTDKEKINNKTLKDTIRGVLVELMRYLTDYLE